jgi:hypothetical protein
MRRPRIGQSTEFRDATGRQHSWAVASHWVNEMPRIYPWESTYQAALKETDPAKRPAAIMAAEEMVLRRAAELQHTATRRSINELAWLEKAIDRLTKLHEAHASEMRAASAARASETPVTPQPAPAVAVTESSSASAAEDYAAAEPPPRAHARTSGT